MAKTLTDWFEDAVESKGQTIGSVLPRMALTFVQPHHQQAFMGSCHGLLARKLTEMDLAHTLKNDDQIVLFGSATNNHVYHSILTDKNGALIFDSLADVEGHHYEPSEKKYISDKMDGAAVEYQRISIEEFKKTFVSRVVVPCVPGNAPKNT